MSKLALVTGASSGIGKELAKVHAEKGGDLIIVARRESNLTQLKEEIESTYNVDVHCIVKDLSSLGAAMELYDEVKNKGLIVDYLINNAGFGLRGKFHELPWDRQLQMMNLNMTAVSELMHLYIPDMVQRNSGKVLNNSSTASYMPGPLQAVYFATKAYVQSLSNAISEELVGTNVTVTNLMPGATESEFAKTSGMEETELFKKTRSARSVAEDGYNAMLAGKLDVVTGMSSIQKMMLGMTKILPKKVLMKQVKKMQEV